MDQCDISVTTGPIFTKFEMKVDITMATKRHKFGQNRVHRFKVLLWKQNPIMSQWDFFEHSDHCNTKTKEAKNLISSHFNIKSISCLLAKFDLDQ